MAKFYDEFVEFPRDNSYQLTILLKNSLFENVDKK